MNSGRGEFYAEIFGKFVQIIGGIIGGIIGIIAIGFGVFFAIGFAIKLFDGVSKNVVWACAIERVEVRSEIFVVNGEPDAGFVVDVFTRKTNKDGDVTVKVMLSSTEGNIEKKRTMRLGIDKVTAIQVHFPEPTINAQQVQAIAECTTL